MPDENIPQQPNNDKKPSPFEGYSLIKALNVILIIEIVCCILYLIGSPLMTVLGLLGSVLGISIFPLLSVLITILQMIAYLVFAFRARKELKEKSVKFVDTVFYMALVGFAAWIVTFIVNFVSRLVDGRISGVFISTTISGLIGQVLGVAVGLVLLILFFAKSKQLKAWFGLEGNAIRYSRFWPWISKLPSVLTDENMPEAVKPDPQAQPMQQPVVTQNPVMFQNPDATTASSAESVPPSVNQPLTSSVVPPVSPMGQPTPPENPSVTPSATPSSPAPTSQPPEAV